MNSALRGPDPQPEGRSGLPGPLLCAELPAKSSPGLVHRVLDCPARVPTGAPVGAGGVSGMCHGHTARAPMRRDSRSDLCGPKAWGLSPVSFLPPFKQPDLHICSAGEDPWLDVPGPRRSVELLGARGLSPPSFTFLLNCNHPWQHALLGDALAIPEARTPNI